MKPKHSEITRRAATFDERVNDATQEQPDAGGTRRLGSFGKLHFLNDAESLSGHLSDRSLTREQLCQLLNDIPQCHPDEDWLRAFYNASNETAYIQDVEDELVEKAVSEIKSLFNSEVTKHVWEPLTQSARARVRFAFHGWGDEFSLNDSPIVARWVTQTIADWKSMVVQLLERLRRDRAVIQDRFSVKRSSRLYGVSIDMGDLHDRGQCVVILQFECGAQLVYKPRDTRIDVQLSQFCRWVKSAGGDCGFEVPYTLSRSDHAWVEYVAKRTCEDIGELSAYFQHFGSAMSMMQLLHGTDLHFENIAVVRNRPVFLDTETLFQPAPEQQTGIGHANGRGLARSVFSTSLLPQYITVDEMPFNAGGCASPKFTPADSLNNPFRPDTAYSDHQIASALCEGYERQHNFFTKERESLLSSNGPLSLFQSTKTRLVFRNTGSYVAAIRTLRERRLTNSADVILHCEGLARFFHKSHLLHHSSALWAVHREETAALERLNVPRFTADVFGNRVYSHRGPIGQLLRERPVESVLRTIHELSPSSLAAQLELIETTVCNKIQSGVLRDDQV